MHGRAARDDRVVMHVNMPAQQYVIDQSRVVIHMAVMSDVGMHHHQVVTADPSRVVLFLGSTMHGYTFAAVIVVAHDQPCGCSRIPDVLWLTANHAAVTKPVATTDHRVSQDAAVTFQQSAITNHDVRAHVAERANLHILAENGPRMDLRKW